MKKDFNYPVKRNAFEPMFSDWDGMLFPRFPRFFENDGFNFPSLGNLMASITSDIKDKGDSYQIEAELPGFKKDEISLTVEDDTIIISAESKEDTSEEKYLRKERQSRSVRREYRFSDFDVENIKAKFENGVLEVEIPKIKEPEKESKNILID